MLCKLITNFLKKHIFHTQQKLKIKQPKPEKIKQSKQLHKLTGKEFELGTCSIPCKKTKGT